MKCLLSKEGEKYKFVFVHTDSLILLESQPYTRKSSAIKGAESVKVNCIEPLKYVRKKDYFSLRAGNNREIGRSPIMSEEQMEEAMSLLQKYGAEAEVVFA